MENQSSKHTELWEGFMKNSGTASLDAGQCDYFRSSYYLWAAVSLGKLSTWVFLGFIQGNKMAQWTSWVRTYDSVG